MKKANMTQIIAIALWPIIFLLIIGVIEMRLHIRDVLNFQIFYRLLLIPVYILSGCIFAAGVIYQKDATMQKPVVWAYVASALVVILYSVFWVLAATETVSVFPGNAVRAGVTRVPIGVFSLVLGLTIFAAIRAVVLYKKAVA